MSRKKDRKLWQHRFNLSSDREEQARLHEHLNRLAEDNAASEWIVNTLIAALGVPGEYVTSTTVVPVSPAAPTILGRPVEVDPDLPPNTIELRSRNQTVHVENVAPPANRQLTPNEIIKANQAAARAKHPLPPSLPKK